MKKHYETHVEDTDKLISVAGPELDYKSWYEQYRKLMEEQAQRKYGLYTPTSEGDDDDFPSIPGMIARYSALGLTNEQMKENPVWVDKTGNGHDLQMKNFLWGGMSGVGGYGDENHQTFYKFTLDDYVFIASPPGVKHMNFTFRVTGLQPGNKLTLAFFGTTNTVYGTWDKDGIYTVDADIVEAGKPTYFYNGYGATRGEFTIEILPLYPGALVFDGVDDWAGCDNLPLLPKEKGYSIIALRNWITRHDATQYKRPLISNLDTNDEGAFLIEYRKDENVNDVTGSYNSFTDVYIDDNSPITWQTSSSYNGQIIKKGTSKSTNKLCICKTYFGRLSNYTNAAIWEIVILDHDATEEELTKIKDYFVKTYPWLFFDQAWTVTGKTNEDEDRATIANITGNGNDLVLSNFGFAEGSGYGLYAYNFNSFSLKDNTVKPTDVKKDSFRIIGTGDRGNVLVLSNVSNSADWKIRITGMKDGDHLLAGNANKSGDYIKITKDGVYTFQKQYAANATNGIWYNSSQEVDVLVEQIPEYEGYLITDGVDDKVQSSSFTMNEDWTIVGDWELLSNVQINCGIVKAQNVYLYNIANGLLISINNPRSLQSFGTKSLHAICSDGRLYDRNWVEYEYTVDQNFAIVKSSLNIGFNLNNYTQIAFKNLGIYNNQILSKEDCIKAYNYLQTLKAK
nr:MAG: hypothetical protein [Bacteriophage sp.]